MGEFWIILLLVVWSSFCYYDNNWDRHNFIGLAIRITFIICYFYSSITFSKIVFLHIIEHERIQHFDYYLNKMYFLCWDKSFVKF